MTNDDKQKNNEDKSYNPSMIAYGLCLGVAFGAAFDNVGLGIAFGLCFGAGLAYTIPSKSKDENSAETTEESSGS